MSEMDFRLAEAGSGAGVVAQSPVARLRSVLGEPAAGEYNDWVQSRFGKLVVAALRHLALHGPARFSDASVPVQHGITLGLSFAADLLSDPSSVVSGVFAPPRPAAPAAPEYLVSPDGMSV